MGKCSNCGSMILFGGIREGQMHYCGDKCHQQHSPVLQTLNALPANLVAEHTSKLHQGNCPKCGGPGPVDVFTSYRVWSALVLTSWNEKPEICCSGCAAKSKIVGILISGTLGWWGFPWGLIVTPVQLFRNFMGLISTPDSTRPSEDLTAFVRMVLATQITEAVPTAEAVPETSSPFR